MTLPTTDVRSGHVAPPLSGSGLLQGARGRDIRNLLLALAFLSPSLLVFLFFVFIPLFRSIQLSVHATNPIGQMRDFVGLEHYQRMFSDPEFYNSMRVSVTFAFYAVSLTLIGSMALALLGNIRVRGITIFRAIFSSTIAVSSAAASLIFGFLFHPAIGVFNYILDLLGLPRVPWLTSTETALFVLSWVTVWLWLGLNTIILLAGMQGISDELYEASRIDGAGFRSQFRHVTLPLLSPTIFFLVIINTLGAFQAFTQFNVLTKGGPVRTTNTLVYSIYRAFYFDGAYGYSSAMAVILLFIMLTLTVIQFSGLEKKVFYQ